MDQFKITVAALMLLLGCGRRDHGQAAAAVSASLTTAAVAPSPPTSPVTVPSLGMHDPAHPPIDCPLHHHGVDSAHLLPFEDVEKYIAHLERPERAVWQKPDEVVAALGLRGTETIVDVGAGSGYFAFRLAKALPKGKVIAEDTQAEMVRHIHHKAMTEGISNLEARIVEPSDPAVPRQADWVFVCDVLHHVSDRPHWLKRVAKAMKPGSKLALIEYKTGNLPQGPPEHMKIPRAELLSLMIQAGFALEREHDQLLPYQLFLVFGKP